MRSGRRRLEWFLVRWNRQCRAALLVAEYILAILSLCAGRSPLELFPDQRLCVMSVQVADPFAVVVLWAAIERAVLGSETNGILRE